MAWQCSGRSNEELIENLWRRGLIKSPTVRDAMKKVDRAHYCPDVSSAYEDSPQLIGHSATISAPHMHASALESLLTFIGPGKRVLDIGSGSGYLTAVMGELVFPQDEKDVAQGKVIGLEHIKQLRELGEKNMEKSARGKQLLGSGNVKFVQGDGRMGYVDPGAEDAERSGWDAIHVGAAAVTLHPELISQLRSPGRIFIPVEDEKGRGQWIWVVDKDEMGKVRKERREGVRYVPLTDAPR